MNSKYNQSVKELAFRVVVLLHLENQIPVFKIDVILNEEGAIVLEAPVIADVPSASVYCAALKVIPKMKIESFAFLVIIVYFNVVVLYEPGHSCIV